MSAVVAEWRVAIALSENVSRYVNYLFRNEDWALVYSDTKNGGQVHSL